MTDTVPVEFTVTKLRRPMRPGALIAVVDVAVDIAGVEIVLHGVQVARRQDGKIEARAPLARDERGALMSAVTLPDALEQAIGRTVLKEVLYGAR